MTIQEQIFLGVVLIIGTIVGCTGILLTFIHFKINKVMAENEQLAEEMQSILTGIAENTTAINESLVNIEADINNIINNTPTSGGLSEEKAQNFLAQLRTIGGMVTAAKDKGAQIDLLNPAVPTEPQPELPAEPQA